MIPMAAIQEQIDLFNKKKAEIEKQNKKDDSAKDINFLLFGIEIGGIVLFVMGAIFLLWFFAPYSYTMKLILTAISSIIIFDVFKNFVYVKWVLLREEE